MDELPLRVTSCFMDRKGNYSTYFKREAISWSFDPHECPPRCLVMGWGELQSENPAGFQLLAEQLLYQRDLHPRPSQIYGRKVSVIARFPTCSLILRRDAGWAYKQVTRAGLALAEGKASFKHGLKRQEVLA